MCGFDTLPLSLTRLVEYWRLRLRAKFDTLGFRTLRGVRSKAKEQKRFFFSFQKSQQPKIHAANQKQPTRINKMRRTNNAEQVSPSRRSLRRRKRSDQTSKRGSERESEQIRRRRNFCARGGKDAPFTQLFRSSASIEEVELRAALGGDGVVTILRRGTPRRILRESLHVLEA
jgi:hypothetical protein